MKIRLATLDTCHTAQDVVVAIDVVRAFTTAAHAFAVGAQRILLVGSVNDALELRDRFPGSLAMGEQGGLPAPGFDLWNSPAQFTGMDLAGKILVQRTSAGTQGAVRATGARRLFAASFVVARATVRAVQALQPDEVTFIITGAHPEDPRYGREDAACAEYMTALLAGKHSDPSGYLTWVSSFIEIHLVDAPEEIRKQFMIDLELCTQVDRFHFAMPVRREHGLLIMEKSYVPST